jgi:hypothetical protein
MVTIREASGCVHAGIHLHGAGGPMNRQGIEREIRRATAGRDLLIYEPVPGHARAYVQTSLVDCNERIIDLRGAMLL